MPPTPAKRYALVDGASELMALGNWLEFLGSDDVKTASPNPAAQDLGAHTWSVTVPGELLVIFATPSAATDATVAVLQRASVALSGFDLRGALTPMTPAAAELCAPPMERASRSRRAVTQL